MPYRSAARGAVLGVRVVAPAARCRVWPRSPPGRLSRRRRFRFRQRVPGSAPPAGVARSGRPGNPARGPAAGAGPPGLEGWVWTSGRGLCGSGGGPGRPDLDRPSPREPCPFTEGDSGEMWFPKRAVSLFRSGFEETAHITPLTRAQGPLASRANPGRGVPARLASVWWWPWEPRAGAEGGRGRVSGGRPPGSRRTGCPLP